MFTNNRAVKAAHSRGVTLIEMIIFIVIVSVALVAILTVLNITAQHSGDPLINKQLQAIAEEYMEEVTAMPFTYCDPEDANVLTASSSAGCAIAALSEATVGPKTVNGSLETRGINPTFNNVGNYAGYSSANASDASGTHTFNGYSVAVTVAFDAAADLGPSTLLISNSAVLHITVVVSNAANSFKLEGYRTRYAPNAVP
jgi:MSHA pilin protein MshD